MSCSKEPANDDRPFEFKNLPAELVENIYLYSGNLQLPLVNRSFYYLLSHDTTRLRLCSYIFNHSFTSKYEYTNPNFSADNEDDMEVVKLQTNLLNQVWFNGPFALRLEVLTPELQARAIYRRGEDGQLRQGLPPLQWCGTGPRVTEGNVHMPKTWLIGPWTEDRAEMFHRLRGWYIDPQAFSEPERTRLDQAREQAIADGKDDVWEELTGYIRAASTGTAACCTGSVTALPVDEALLLQNNGEMEEAQHMPLPEEDDTDFSNILLEDG